MFEDLDDSQNERCSRLIVVLTALIMLLTVVLVLSVFDLIILHTLNERLIQRIEVKQQVGEDEQRLEQTR